MHTIYFRGGPLDGEIRESDSLHDQIHVTLSARYGRDAHVEREWLYVRSDPNWDDRMAHFYDVQGELF